MKSLRTYLDTLAPIFGMTPAALYERQRELIREGVLDNRSGRGPGSGVPFDADSVTWLLLAIMSSEIRSISIDRARQLARAKPLTGICVLTHQRTLAASLATILGSPSIAKTVASVSVDRKALHATLRWVSGRRGLTLQYSTTGAPQPPGLRVEATLDGATLSKIADDLAAEVSSPLRKGS